ncbi:TonB-dependent receptor [Galbibacter sp. EGI 63066]|uniref:SusC/RagA family TonB-linked outer membrane protein n=1 Tax=Galbibacter sp. EGI 63066 TaxID=2993559 RepID=UPI002248EB94|nr:TonB-dependent receptor [Galbibacter sp. EGI 63066]MCX2679998.1 TonB-dependent receptor [Galbibacter sp. EGI 63066]
MTNLYFTLYQRFAVLIWQKLLPLKKVAGVLVLMGFFLVGTYSVNAQDITVSGQVLAGDVGGPLPGVSIIEKGTQNGVASDFDGNYTISVSGPDAVLVFSFIGYVAQEVSVNGRTAINVTMEGDVNQLEEVVLIDYGYGKVSRQDMTGSVASMSSNELAKIPVSSTAEALSGRLPGVNVSTTDGEPGADINIRVRGGGSITQDNSPLYVVDGFIVGSINDIAPNDIASIDVLKDAAATAIYGSQAANGVIVITTKSPIAGKVSVDYNNYFQYNTFPSNRKYEVLSPHEYVFANYEYAKLQGTAATENFERFFGVYDDMDLYRSKKGTDWQEELFGGKRLSQYHNLTVSGGTDMTKMRLSFSHNNDEGVMIGSGYERTTINFKLNQKIVDGLTFDASARISNSIRDGAGTSRAQLSIKDVVQARPVNGIADELDIDLTQLGSSSDNDYESFLLSLISPTELVKQDWRKRTDKRYVLNAGLTWSIIDGLNLKTTFTNQRRFWENLRFYGPLTGESFNNGGSMPLGEKDNREYLSYRWLTTLNYKKQWGEDHKLDVLVGYEVSSNGSDRAFIRGEDYRLSITPEELFANMQIGRIDRTFTREETDVNRRSIFGRADFQLQNKYIWTATLRADRSSKFSEKYNLGVFPALAFAWKADEEDFLKSADWIDELKLRITYGETGNDRIDADASQFSFSPETNRGPGFGNEEQVYYTPSSSSLYNPELKWETTVTNNVGLDFGLFNRRLSGSFDLYKNETRDLLLQSAVSPNSGFETQWNNIGSTSNTGVELGLNAYLIEKSDFSLSTNFNIGANTFKIEELDGTTERFERSNWASTDLNNISDYHLEEGGKVGNIYGYVTDGMYSTDDFASYDETSGDYILNEDVPNSGSVVGNTNIRPGFLKLKDLNGDGEINADDRQVIGNALPDFQGGIGINARYKGFDFSAFFNYQYGNDVYNTGKIQYNQFRRVTYGNLLDRMNSDNRFTYIDVDGQYTGTPGEVVTDLDQLAELNEGKNIWSHASHGIAGAVVHSWAIEDGSFIRLNNLTLGYSFPVDLISKIGMTKLRLYATGRNLHVWTNYSGYDPEVDSRRNSGLTPGVDYSSYPRSRSYTLGLNITF